MKNAIEIGKISARGSIILSFGQVVSNLILALGTFLVAGLLSASEYGLYGIALTVPAVFQLFQDLGLTLATIKYTAQFKAEDKGEEIKKILATALTSEAIAGICLSLTAFLLADLIATTVMGRPELVDPIRIASAIILSQSVVYATQSSFVGYEKLQYTTLTMITFSALKTFTAPALILMGFGVTGAIAGNVVASAATAFVGFAFFFFRIYRKVKSEIMPLRRFFKNTFSMMIKYGLPLSISSMLGGFLIQFYNLLLYRVVLDNVAIGNYQMAGKFIIFMAFLSGPISTTLFPAFSKLNPEKDREVLKKVFQMSVKYASLLVVPASVALMVLSAPLIGTLFGGKYSSAPMYLMLLAISGLNVGVGSLSVGNLLNGQGKTKTSLLLTLLNVAVGVPLSLYLIPSLGIIGLILTTLVYGLPSLAVGLWYARKHFTATVEISASAKIYLCSGLAGIITFFVLLYLSTFPAWIPLAIGATLFLSLCMCLLGLTRTLDRKDMQNLRGMFGGMGPLSRLIRLFLKIIESLSLGI